MAGRRHKALAALWLERMFGGRRRFSGFVGSGGSRVRGGAAEEGVDLREISDAIVSHSKVTLKLGYSGSEGKVLGFRCRWLRFTAGAGHVSGIILKPVFG